MPNGVRVNSLVAATHDAAPYGDGGWGKEREHACFDQCGASRAGGDAGSGQSPTVIE
jgi:hypothetical protein